MPNPPIEREVKFAVAPEFTVPDLQDLVKQTVRLPDQRLLAVYFDTSDHRLWARKITLRHRTGEGLAGGIWTLKLPQPSAGRTLDRTELEWHGTPDSIPEELSKILRGIVRREALHKITSLGTTRRRLTLEGRNQTRLAELDDDLVTIHGGPHDGGRFRQIEVELHEADGELLERCVERLTDAGARIDNRGPKLARAIGDDLLRANDGTSLGQKPTIADVLRASIRTGFGRILDNEYLLRLEGDPPPEAIHQTRVAARRLRSDLQTFKPVLDPLWVSHTRDDLKWLGGALGLVRDADVLGLHLDLNGSPTMGETKGKAALRVQLEDQRRSAAEKVAAALNSERYLLLLDKLHAAAELPPLLSGGSAGRIRPSQRASKALPKVVKHPWKKLRKEVRKAGREPTDRQLHRIRIGAKRLRYAAEAAEPVMGREAKRLAAAAAGLQTQLGEHHDAVIAEAWLRNRAKGASSKVAFAAGILAGEQISRQHHYRGDWQGRWEKVDRRAQAWLG